MSTRNLHLSQFRASNMMVSLLLHFNLLPLNQKCVPFIGVFTSTKPGNFPVWELNQESKVLTDKQFILRIGSNASRWLGKARPPSPSCPMTSKDTGWRRRLWHCCQSCEDLRWRWLLPKDSLKAHLLPKDSLKAHLLPKDSWKIQLRLRDLFIRGC